MMIGYYQKVAAAMLLLVAASSSCGQGEEPIIGKNCGEDPDCCPAIDAGTCPDGIYCDNSSLPGQCLKLCSETPECIDSVLGRDNVCVQFTFGGRCMRRCAKENRDICSEGTECLPLDFLELEPFSESICYPCDPWGCDYGEH